ncbi:MAG TPA: LCP family protein [Candidatus Limnocylindrales bacterium]|nr:LCP family protein [Candidatus Limnocylindrales bacterium]
MQTPQGTPPRTRSAFAAAFLSLLFPGLGQAYAGAPARGLAFAAPPLLTLALLAGYVMRADRLELLGFVIQPWVLLVIFLFNVIAAAYRVVAVVDAWRVARFLNEVDVSGGGRLGKPRLPVSPLSVAGVAAVCLVLVGGHLAVARYNVLAMGFVDCVFSEDADAAACEQTPGASPSPDGGSPGTSGDPGEPSEEPAPTPIGTVAPGGPDPSATLPPWDGRERLNVLLIGSDEQGGGHNTDTLIVASIDPATGRVALLQLPRDTVEVPVPAGPARSVWGGTYGGKINSWFVENRNRADLWPGTDRTRGYNALKAILGELYGLEIRWYVEVNFQGFRRVVDTLGGVNINVQIPVSDDAFPTGDRGRLRRLYIPAGPQHMTGEEALQYARSRKTTNDFDRGRRQQRVLLSLREQADMGRIVANLPELVGALQQSIRTDIPPAELPQLLSLAERTDTTNVRSFVFAPPAFATEIRAPVYKLVPNVDRIRQAVAGAFEIDPALEQRRETLAAEGARIWVLNGSGRDGHAAGIAGYLEYNGLNASSPNDRVEQRPRTTRIVVYNGAEARLPDTIAYLEELFGVTVATAADPAVRVDIVITTATSTENLVPPEAG